MTARRLAVSRSTGGDAEQRAPNVSAPATSALDRRQRSRQGFMRQPRVKAVVPTQTVRAPAADENQPPDRPPPPFRAFRQSSRHDPSRGAGALRSSALDSPAFMAARASRRRRLHPSLARKAGALRSSPQLLAFGRHQCSSGSERERGRPAATSAFASAGASAMIGVSPAPAEGMSGRSSRTTSIGGASVNRGTL